LSFTSDDFEYFFSSVLLPLSYQSAPEPIPAPTENSAPATSPTDVPVTVADPSPEPISSTGNGNGDGNDNGNASGTEEGENVVPGEDGVPSPPEESGEDIPQEGVLDLTAVEGGEGDNNSNTGSDRFVAGGNGSLGTGPIIGIATGAAACLLIFFLVAGRRHRDDSQEKALQKLGSEGEESFSTPDPKFLTSVDALADTCDKSRGNKRSISQFDPSALVEQIVSAIDKANWDEVYKLASQLAEQEDLSTLSSVVRQTRSLSGTASRMTRAHLSEEDQERTRTLDELVESSDWTGVAVTAALYAGESGYSRDSASTKRSFLDIVTGKRATSKAVASLKDDSLGAMPSSAAPLGASALGALTDDTKSGTSDEGRTFSQTSTPSSTRRVPQATGSKQARRASSAKPAPPAGAFGLGTTDSQTDSSMVLGQLKDRIDTAVDSGDWNNVLRLSSEVEKNNAFRGRTPLDSDLPSRLPQGESQSQASERSDGAQTSLKEELDRAVYDGNWALVSFYADRIREKRTSGSSGTEITQPFESNALVPVTRPQSVPAAQSTDTSDSEMAKRHTIDKLVKAQKWKGVSIMAGLYKMESKGSTSIE
jgi:ElaB/YqjD/DUF883 family membrane-anchored ribosome-binding protein